MGKKSRAAPGRRPILQLSPPGPRRDEAAASQTEGADSGSEAVVVFRPHHGYQGRGRWKARVLCGALPSTPQPACPVPNGSSLADEPEAVAEPPRSVPNPPPPTPSAMKPTGGLCLLGAYADSDEEEGETPEKLAQPADTNGSNSSDIDSTLANFLAEIDAITAPPQPTEPSTASSSSSVPPPTPPRPEPKESGTSQASGGNANSASSALTQEWQYDTQCSLAGVGELEMGDWQEVWDENTGCYYYWNTQSNEVTWELPQCLAAQVQGLQHYQHSSTSANGSFATAATELYAQEKGIAPGGVGRGASLATREVKKEVNEGVQALSNSEEEKKGVAAALLAPLLPEQVKEEEERWRRKVICKEEVEPPPEEEVKGEEATAAVPEESEPSRDLLEDTVQEELCSMVQSGESAEEEEEQDTLELEMVLERKKAELRALEEGDGSVSGSSPRSDSSQSAPQDSSHRLASKRGKWKLFVGAASPESTSRASSKTGRESPEAGEAAPSTEAADAISDKEAESEEPQEKTKTQGAPKIEEEEQGLKFQIGELANTLTSKLEFLGINRQSVSNFHMLLLQTETRIADWREGALNGIYLKRKLQDAAEQLKQYEINATPKGWSCHWDREHRRYFYVNERSGESQWEFPDGEDEEEEGGERSSDRKSEGPPKPPKDKGERTEEPAERSSTGSRVHRLSVQTCVNVYSSDSHCKESFSGQVPATSLMPVTPFWTLLQSSVPVLQPPLPLEMPPPPPGTEEDAPLKPLLRPATSSTQVSSGSPVRLGLDQFHWPTSQCHSSSCDKILKVLFLQAAMELTPTPTPLLSAKPQKRKAAEMSPGVLQRAATIGSCPVIYSQPLMATSKYQPQTLPLGSLRPRQRLQPEIQGRPNLRLTPGHTGAAAAALGLQSGYLGVTAPATSSVIGYSECTVPGNLTAAAMPPAPARAALPATGQPPPPPPPPQTPPPPTPKAPPPPPEKEKPRKGRKDKGKKGKTKMPSLVKKWQSIQRELDEEENSSSSEEDRETTAQRRIEEWKQQQLMSGMAERNANFEALPEDWRARLKRRKTASST
ncbi:FNBP4 protein, partial [Eubucco bourcierii]|nr:FNBP4 protein [Eubucco bourcierii]